MANNTTKRSYGQFDTKNFDIILQKIITAINAEGDRKKVLSVVMVQALTVANVEMGGLFVAGDDPKRLNIVSRQGMSDALIKQLATGDLGRLFVGGQRLWIKPHSMKLNPGQALLGRHKLKFLFGLPLRFERHVLGAIVIGSRTVEANSLSDQVQEQLAALASLVALFLDDVRLRTYKVQSGKPGLTDEAISAAQALKTHTEANTPDDMEQLLAAVMSAEEEVIGQNADLGILNSLSSEVSSTLQLGTILESAIKNTMNALETESGWCYLFEDGDLVLRGHYGLSKKYVYGMQTLPPGDGVEGMAFTRNESIFRDGVLFHSGKARKLVQEEGLRTIAAIPLKNDDNTTFGVLAVANNHERIWSARDRRMLDSIGRQVTHAIINAKKYSQVEESAHTWETGYSVLEQTNAQLARNNEALKQQIEELRQAEQQIWTALAASHKSKLKYSSSDPNKDEQLMAALKKFLQAMNAQDIDQQLSQAV